MIDLCRLCGIEKCFIDLIDLKDCEFNIFRAVDLHCRVILQKNKLLPQSVCKTCVDFINSIVSFSENVKSVQNRLISDLQNIGGNPSIQEAGKDDSESEFDIKAVEVKLETLESLNSNPGTSGAQDSRNRKKRAAPESNKKETKSKARSGKKVKTSPEPAGPDEEEERIPDIEEVNEQIDDLEVNKEEIEDIFEASDEEFVPAAEVNSDSDVDYEEKKPAKKKKPAVKKTESEAPKTTTVSAGHSNNRNSIFATNLFEVIFKEDLEGSYIETPQDFDIPVEYKKGDGTIAEEGWHLVSPIKWNDAVSTDCKQCNENFDNVFLLKEHYRTKHTARTPGLEISCKSCKTKKRFSSLHPVVNHVVDQHFKHLKYCCFLCSSMFWNFTSLYHHLQSDHPEVLTSILFCLICGVHYYDKKQMQRHRDSHRDGNKSFESIFFKELNTDLSLMENKLAVLESEKNTDGSITESGIARLQLTRWDAIRIDCSLCDVKDLTILELKEHFSKDHDKSKPRDRVYTCKTGICTFAKSCEKIGGVVVHHILSHDKKLSYGCIVCSKIFWNHVSLHYHYRHAHYQLKPYICLYCGFFSRDMAQLHRHLLSHDVEGIKKHICEHCGKPFATNSNLKMHVDQVHTEVMNFECKICHHKFKSKYRYRYHIATHTDARPHQCPICKARFKAKVTLNDHYRTHFSERRYGCSHCDKRFHKGHDLKVHERLHTGDFPYSCSVCGERYPAWSNLFKHAKSRHGLDIASKRAKTYRDIKENDVEIPEILRDEVC